MNSGMPWADSVGQIPGLADHHLHEEQQMKMGMMPGSRSFTRNSDFLPVEMNEQMNEKTQIHEPMEINERVRRRGLKISELLNADDAQKQDNHMLGTWDSIRPSNMTALWNGSEANQLVDAFRSSSEPVSQSVSNVPANYMSGPPTHAFRYSPGVECTAQSLGASPTVLPSFSQLAVHDKDATEGSNAGSYASSDLSPSNWRRASSPLANGVSRLGISKETNSPRLVGGMRQQAARNYSAAQRALVTDDDLSPANSRLNRRLTDNGYGHFSAPSQVRGGYVSTQTGIVPQQIYPASEFERPQDATRMNGQYGAMVQPTFGGPQQNVEDDEGPYLTSSAQGTPRKRCATGGSKFCHVCRHLGKSSSLLCSNSTKGTCKKVICERCFVKNKWDWESAASNPDAFICCHCRGECPSKASCYTYKEVNKRRGKDNGRRVISLPKTGDDSSPSSQAEENTS
uniref:Zinc-finger domain-containing protein n=1 Tax=Timspurckia oligopyrenoides TaxID=708627 RepID=A0A7S0ZJW2_9RHOD